MLLDSQTASPLYQQVKEHVLQGIARGDWPVSGKMPSENELVRTLGVSRMTVNRALKELSAEGIILRIAGVGTFVADRSAHAHPLQIRNIADEIRSRGHEHRAVVVTSEVATALPEIASEFGLRPGSKLFHTVIVHQENGQPIQLEDRYVNAAVAPDYLKIDFTQTTPYEYLIRVAPLQSAEHVLKAVMPDAGTRKLLKMGRGEPCLLLLRRTWTDEKVASAVRLYYPGDRYDFVGSATI